MNELQIRLSADIKQFQAAMSTVETKLQRAEGILKKASVSADKYRGSLATLAGQLKRGEISQEEYNKGSTKLSNGLLKQQDIINNSTREVSRLSNEYKKLNTGSLIKGQNDLATSSDNLTGSLRGTNSVSNSLSRTLKDLPGGITPLFENVRQLTSNFSNLTKTAGGVGPAIAQTLKSFVTPANIALLAVSALAAAFTAYKMGAFDAKEETRDLGEELDKYRKTLDLVSQAQIQGASNAEKEIQNFKLLKAQAENANIPLEKRVEAVKELQAKYPEYLGNLTQEQILTGEVGASYEQLTKQIVATAKARAASDKIAENSIKILTLEEQSISRVNEILVKRDKLAKLEELQQNQAANNRGVITGLDLQILDIRKDIFDLSKEQGQTFNDLVKLKEDEKKLTSEINKLISEGASFTDAKRIATEKAGRAVKDLASEWEKFLSSGVDSASEIDKFLAGFTDKLNNFKIASSEPIDLKINLGDAPIKEFADELETVQVKVTDNAQAIASAFSGMSFQISEALGISNRNLRAFVGTLISNTPKIISALMAQAKASNAAASLANKGNFAQAKGNVVVSATSAAKGLGPVGLALLPVLIAGGLALISGAFGKSGGGGGGAVATGGPQSFGNASIPQPTSQSLGDQSSRARPSAGSGRLEAIVTGDQIRFVLDQSGRRAGRG